MRAVITIKKGKIALIESGETIFSWRKQEVQLCFEVEEKVKGGAAGKDEKTGLVVWEDPMQPALMGSVSAQNVGIRYNT